MKLFEGNAVNRINNILDKSEKRRTKLQTKLERLQEEHTLLYQAEQDDFNEAILDDKEPNKKISSDRRKLAEEIQDTQHQLTQIDAVVINELEKQKNAVDEERKQFVKDKRKDFNKQFDKMQQLKIAYLESIVDYVKLNNEFKREYAKTFRSIEKRVGLREFDPYYEFHFSLNQRHQISGQYNPVLYNDELREALEGKVSPSALKHKDKFKA